MFVYNKHTPRKPDGSRPRSIKKEEDIIRVPGGVPAIVSEDLWERVNCRLERNKSCHGASRAKEVYLLSGLIFCGECGHRMNGNGRYPAPDRPKLITYRCSRRYQYRDCMNKEIKRDDVENFVLDQLQRNLFREEMISHITQSLNQYIASTRQQDIDLKRYQATKKELTARRANIVQAIAKTGFEETFSRELAEIESQLAKVLTLLDQHKQQKPMEPVTETMVREYLGSVKEFILKRDKPQIKKFIDSYVERVDVYMDKVKVTLKVALGSEQSLEYAFDQHSDRQAIKSA